MSQNFTVRADIHATVRHCSFLFIKYHCVWEGKLWSHIKWIRTLWLQRRARSTLLICRPPDREDISSGLLPSSSLPLAAAPFFLRLLSGPSSFTLPRQRRQCFYSVFCQTFVAPLENKGIFFSIRGWKKVWQGDRPEHLKMWRMKNAWPIPSFWKRLSLTEG